MTLLSALALASPAARADGLTISTGGTANFEKSLAVPPGIAGMVPNLALQYTGSGGGVLGRGWGIRGVSSITRCGPNRLTDGIDGSVTFTAQDKLCLDGQRLIQTDAAGVPVNGGVTNPGPANPFQQNDSLGGTGMVREYRTEKDSFARVRAYGALGGDAANGPAYFKVWTKGGQIHEYGVASNTVSNAAVLAQGKTVGVVWGVSRISDTLGNYIDFNYEQRDVAWGTYAKGTLLAAGPAPGREWMLKEVLYTGHGTQAPANKVTFDYIDAPAVDGLPVDASESYHLGSKTVALRRLESITTYVNGAANPVRVLRYKFGYDNGGVHRRSRLAKITECAGPADGKCLPPVTFGYSPGGGTDFTRSERFAASGMATAALQGNDVGILTGNFFGSGRTDILRWSNDANQNLLYRSTGDGGFEQVAAGAGPGQFSLAGVQLFKSDGCFVSTAVDFNADGKTDILRTTSSGPDFGHCGTPTTLLFLSNGDGSFQTKTITGIDFAQVPARLTDHYFCEQSLAPSPAATAANRPAPARSPTGGKVMGAEVCNSQQYGGSDRTEGKNYALLDVNRDGRMDVVTSIAPAFGQTGNVPTDEELCASRVCTRVFLGQGDGTFVEKTDTNVAHRSLYGDPPTSRNAMPLPMHTEDMNGDGNTDVLGVSGAWFSRGDGNFDTGGELNKSVYCAVTMDANGDGRPDCLFPHWRADLQTVVFSDGTLTPGNYGRFNLTNAGDELSSLDVDGKPATIGYSVADIDGDGRTDILRWSDDTSRNAVYLSNGDGSFRKAPFNLTTAADQLRKSDGKLGYVLGDFTGNGNVEILRLSSDHTGDPARSNALFVRQDQAPADQLRWVRTGTGLQTDLTWVPLTNSSSGTIGPRYFNDAGTALASAYPVQDMLAPLHVVATLTADTGDGVSRLATEYTYAGLRVSYDGRGWLGFREMRRQSPTPDGKLLTVLTGFVQDGLNTGVTQLTRTWLGDIFGTNNPVVLSNTFNIYCDRTSPVAAEADASTISSCPTTAKVRKPYLHSSRADGWDINGVALPTIYTVNTFNDSGDPTKIVVNTQGNTAGMSQSFTKTTVNQYYANSTADDSWLLGRLEKATVTGENRIAPLAQAAAMRKTGARAMAAAADLATVDVIKVKDIAATIAATAAWTRDNGKSITNSAGSAPYATAIKGVEFAVKVTPSPFTAFGTKAGELGGTLTATVTGGIAPFAYDWTRVDGERFEMLAATIATPAVRAVIALGENITENWKVTVRDSTGAVATAVVPITLAVPAGPVAVTVAPSPLKVDGTDPGDVSGTVTAKATGGIPPYKYAWTRYSGSKTTVADANVANPVITANLAAGASLTETWRVTVTDAADKTASVNVSTTFTAPAALAVPLTATRSVTVGSTGTASTALSVTPTGGRAPYTYAWTRTGGEHSTISNAAVSNPTVTATLAAGQTSVETWTLEVTDSVGHVQSASIAITFTYPAPAMAWSPTPPSISVRANDPGPASGQYNINPTGGLPPYTYAWTRYSGTRTALSDPAVQNPVVSATLNAGDNFSETWKVTVTDTAGKTLAANVSAAFNAPTALAVVVPATRSATAASTTGLASASLTTAVTGGRSPYTYQWQRTSGTRSTISEPTGANPYARLDMKVGETVVEAWTVTVTDSVGHTVTGTSTITFNFPAPALGLTFTPTSPRTDAPDPGLVSVNVTANPTGGIPPYSYAWARYTGTKTTISNAAIATPVISATVAAGTTLAETWRLTVTDSAGKTIAANVTATLTAPAPLAVPLAATKAASYGSASNAGVSSTTMSVTPTGGRTPYTYAWSRVSGSRSEASSATVSNPVLKATLSLGETVTERWRLVVSDSVGHTASSDTDITFAYPAPALGVTFSPTAVTAAAPDPGVATGTTTATATGGVPPYRYSWARSTGTRSTVNNATLAAPTFSANVIAGESFGEQWKVTVTDSAGKTVTGTVTATFSAPYALTGRAGSSTTSVAVTASTSGKGTATLSTTASGGRSPYTYSWRSTAGGMGTLSNPNIAGPVLSVTLTPGQTVDETWEVTVRDAVGHAATSSVTVKFSYPLPPLTITATPASPTATITSPGLASAAVHLDAANGLAPYNFTWRRSSGSGTNILSGSGADVVLGAQFAVPGRVSETWTVDVTDARGAKGSRSVAAVFTHSGIQLTCTNGPNANNFTCSVYNWTSVVQREIIIRASESAMSWSPNTLKSCAANSYCGGFSLNLTSKGRHAGTVDAIGDGVISNAYSYDVNVP